MRIANDPTAYLSRAGLTPSRTTSRVDRHPAQEASFQASDPTRTKSTTPALKMMQPVSMADVMSAADSAAPSSPLQGLLDQWGGSGSPFDGNADGTVDGADLGLLLAGMAGQVGGAAAEATDPNGVIGAWGGADAAADLNGDGVVDVLDMALFGAATQAMTMLTK